MKISLIIPYKNEEKKISYTFKQILNQALLPDEVIFVNSSSTDNSYELLDKLIKKNKKKIKFKNLNTTSSNPSMSKNLGIKEAKFNWIAFMDIDQKFSKNWIKNLVSFIKNEKIQSVIGLCRFRGKNIFDVATICQTRGYDSYHEAIPSSIFEKKVFKKYGYFKNLRAGYDRHFINKIKKKIKFRINNKNYIEYKNNSIAENYTKLFKKIKNYTYASLNINYGIKNLLVFFGFIIFFFSLIISFKVSAFFFLIYIFARGYCFPLLKSNNLNFLKKFPKIFFLLPLIAIIIDFAKIIAIFKKTFYSLNK